MDKQTLDKKGILRGALALAQVTELEAMLLIQELFSELKDAPQSDTKDTDANS